MCPTNRGLSQHSTQQETALLPHELGWPCGNFDSRKQLRGLSLRSQEAAAAPPEGRLWTLPGSQSHPRQARALGAELCRAALPCSG